MVAYTTRERVMRAADIRASAYRNAEVDQAVQASRLAIDRLCGAGDQTRPGFAPWTGTITYDWPDSASGNIGSSSRLWLSPHKLVSFNTVTSGGTDVSAAAYGSPTRSGAPFSALSLDRSTGSVLMPGSAAGQRSVSVTGVWMSCALAESALSTWTLGGSVNASATAVVINAPFGVGTLLRIDSERMDVVGRAWTDSGQVGTVAANAAAQTFTVSNGVLFMADDELILDGERMLVRDVVGNTLIVQRAVGGSVIAAHTNAAIYWSRTAIVERGALGTTAAAHTAGAAVAFHKVPPLIEQLAVAYALDQRQQETAAYARVAGSGDSEREAYGRGIAALEARVLATFGAAVKHRAV